MSVSDPITMYNQGPPGHLQSNPNFPPPTPYPAFPGQPQSNPVYPPLQRYPSGPPMGGYPGPQIIRGGPPLPGRGMPQFPSGPPLTLFSSNPQTNPSALQSTLRLSGTPGQQPFPHPNSPHFATLQNAQMQGQMGQGMHQGMPPQGK